MAYSYPPPRLSWLAPAVLVLAVAAPAFACLNDTSSRPAEGQFRSSYDTTTTEKPPSVFRAVNPWGLGALAIGSGVIAGTLVAAAFSTKK